MNKKIKIFLYIILTVFIILLIWGIGYVNDYYHADESVNSYLSGNENVSVIKTSNGLFLDGKGTENAVIFYPGAKVDILHICHYL